MNNIRMHCSTVEVALKTGPDIADISFDLARCIQAAGISEGQISVAMVGSTGSLTTIEYEPGVVEDLKQAVNHLAPPDRYYAHEMAWHDGNGHSHVQAALMGPSLCLPVRRGRLRLGTWQQVVAVNHDNRPRKRTIEVTVIGR